MLDFEKESDVKLLYEKAIDAETKIINADYDGNSAIAERFFTVTDKPIIFDAPDFLHEKSGMLEWIWRIKDEITKVDTVPQEREAAKKIHEELNKRKYVYNFQEWNEGPQIRYYQKEGDCNRNANASFWLTSMDTELRFYFRIADMDRATAYIQGAPQSVIRNFLVSDTGCANRISGNP